MLLCQINYFEFEFEFEFATPHRYIFHISSFWKTKRISAIFILCALLCAILQRFIFHISNSYRTNIRIDYFHFVCICEQNCCSCSNAIWASWRPQSCGFHELFRVTTILSSDIFINLYIYTYTISVAIYSVPCFQFGHCFRKHMENFRLHWVINIGLLIMYALYTIYIRYV